MTLDSQEAKTARYNEFLRWYHTPKHLRESAKRFCELNEVQGWVLTKWKRQLERDEKVASASVMIDRKEREELEQEVIKEQVKSGTYDAVEHLKRNLPAVTQAVIEAAVKKLNPNAIKLIFELTGNYRGKGEGTGELDGVSLAKLMARAMDELEEEKESRKSQQSSTLKPDSGNGLNAEVTPNTLPVTTS